GGRSKSTACTPNTEPGTDTLAIFSPSLMTSTAPLLRKNSLPVFEPAASTTWLAECFTTGNPASLLSKAAASGMSEGIRASFVLMETNYLTPRLQDRVGPKSNCAVRYSDSNLDQLAQKAPKALTKFLAVRSSRSSALPFDLLASQSRHGGPLYSRITPSTQA